MTQKKPFKRKKVVLTLALLVCVAVAAGVVFLSKEMAGKKKMTRTYGREGDSYFDDGLYEEAIAAYEKALKYKPYAYTYYKLAGAYYNTGDYEKAEMNHKKAVALRPQRTAEAYELLGNIYSRQGKYGLAIAAYEDGLKVEPDSVILLNNLADAYANKGNYDEAIAHITKALKIEPDSALVRLTYAEISRKTGDYAKALEELDKIKDDYKYGEPARRMISEIKESAGK